MLNGSIPAVVTPFRNEKVDESAFAEIIENLLCAGVAGIVPVGTTGESPTLSHDEHRRVVSLCVDVVAGRVPVVAGACTNSTHEAIELAAHAKTAGAHAALVICPYYNRPSQEGILAHVQAINDAVALPLILYNVPARTASDLLPGTLERLARLPNVIGLKDAGCKLERVPVQRSACGDDFLLLSGEDATALGFCAMGGDGCISVTCNVAPGQCVAMHRAINDGDYRAAEAINRQLFGLHAAMFAAPSPGPVKFALSLLGRCTPETRLPILPVTDRALQGHIRSAMHKAGLDVQS